MQNLDQKEEQLTAYNKRGKKGKTRSIIDKTKRIGKISTCEEILINQHGCSVTLGSLLKEYERKSEREKEQRGSEEGLRRIEHENL